MHGVRRGLNNDNCQYKNPFRIEFSHKSYIEDTLYTGLVFIIEQQSYFTVQLPTGKVTPNPTTTTETYTTVDITSLQTYRGHMGVLLDVSTETKRSSLRSLALDSSGAQRHAGVAWSRAAQHGGHVAS